MTPSTDPLDVDVGVVMALSYELQPLVARCQGLLRTIGHRFDLYRGTLAGRPIALVRSGAGGPAARRATEALIAGHRPRWVISAGFAGALEPRLKLGDLVLPDEVIDPAGRCFHIDVRVPADRGEAGASTGRMLTVDHVVRTAGEKADLALRYKALAVDMESATVAAVCAERDVRFLGVRVISDEALTDLPPEIEGILTDSGGLKLGTIVGGILMQPSRLGTFWKLRAQARWAGDRLGRFLVPIVRQLP